MGRVSKSITLPEDIWERLEAQVKESKFSSKGRYIEHLISNDATARINELEAQLAEQKREKTQLFEILQRLSLGTPATPPPTSEPIPTKKPVDALDLAIGDMLL